MLLGELVQEFVGRDSATSVHILKAPSYAFHCLLVVLTLPLEVIAEDVIEGIGRALPTPAGILC
jgi:hypothetical protein